MKRIKLAVAVLLLFCGVGLIIFLVSRKQEYTGYEVVKELENSEVSEYSFFDGNLIRCGFEGAQAVSKDGTLLWNITYDTMKNPVFDFSGEMVAMADIGSKQYLLADGTGNVKKYSVPYPIQGISVANQGVTAVLMNGGERDYIYIYSKEGELISEIETVVARDGFPLAIALSSDGKKLVTSYMKVEGDEPESSVTFYNFGSVGQNSIRNLVGQVQYSRCLVPKLEFWGNDTVVVLGDSVMELFSMKETPSPVAKKVLTAEVKSVALGDYLCMIMKNKDGQEVLEVYDKTGKVRMKKVITFPYVGIHTGEDEVVLYSYSGCEIYRVGEGLIFQGTFEGGVRYLYVIGNNRYYLVENKCASVIKLH